MIFAIGLFATIIVRAITSEREADRQLKEDNRRRQPQPDCQSEVNHRPSADFAALIDTIHNEALANRKRKKEKIAVRNL
jgi:hypothetical protein